MAFYVLAAVAAVAALASALIVESKPANAELEVPEVAFEQAA